MPTTLENRNWNKNRMTIKMVTAAKYCAECRKVQICVKVSKLKKYINSANDFPFYQTAALKNFFECNKVQLIKKSDPFIYIVSIMKSLAS